MPEHARVNWNDRVLITGKTQSGKTVLAGYLFAQMAGARRFVVDPKGRLKVGVAPVRKIADIDWAAPLVHYVPSSYDRDEYQELYEVIWLAGGPRVVWTDEVGTGIGPTTANWAPRYLTALQAQGAEHGIGHICCSQRPKNIATVVRSEAEHIFVVGTPQTFTDVKTLAEEIGMVAGRPEELRDRISSLLAREGEHAFLWWQRSPNQLVECAPLDRGWVGRPVAAG